MITITLNQIKAKNPCTYDWKKLLEANGGTSADMDKSFPMASILDSNGLAYTTWCMGLLPEYDELCREFACWCALQTVEFIKPYCSGDDYELIVKYLTTRAASIEDEGDVLEDDDGARLSEDAPYSASAAYDAYSAAVYADPAYAARAAACYAHDAVYDDAVYEDDAQTEKLREMLTR